jgi:hypothetical protein
MENFGQYCDILIIIVKILRNFYNCYAMLRLLVNLIQLSNEMLIFRQKYISCKIFEHLALPVGSSS